MKARPMGHQISRKLEKSKYGGENKNDLAFRDKKVSPKDIPEAVIVNELALESGQWRN